MKRTKASGDPQHRRSTRQRRANGVIPSLTRLSAGGVAYVTRRWDSLRGKWGLSPPFSFFSDFNLPVSYTHTQNPVFQIPFSLSHTHTHHLSLFPSLPPSLPPSLSFSLWFHPLSLPHCLSALGSVENASLALTYQRCQIRGHNFWTEDLGRAPLPPTPCPSRQLYYLISSSSETNRIARWTRVSDSDIYLGGSFCYFRELTGFWG